ncbi:hypothetical protein COEREDRAFT_48822 [Coemansia reversa NRRL 1564]|uniref:Transglycosylase SLT domain-containing protein n=1 Tax=Coemansia reversa (strain ATCC 12441 / NRRL 1564) TaxID=763665 RepID=A0A2G5B3L0_COERN|nr:hypothetical protein COEREDRAFT_48822 [Coemansia reversa NRRL 1564]|eukprot:PIA13571.1 hypothetical protein COEREDRAFT_48822 [Coemansia reversa NRRL 1564]
MKLTFAVGLISLALSLASPCAGIGEISEITVTQLNKAIPERAASDSCAKTTAPEECVTNEKAALAITNAINKYGVTQRGEIVALISLMAYESAKWEYNINHYPGRPGQGTRAMLIRITSDIANTASDKVKNDVRALVLDDNNSFGSAFWYLTSVKPEYHNKSDKLRNGNMDDFKKYIEDGVQTTWDDDRQKIWESVNAAL